jgi:hypothetical protein
MTLRKNCSMLRRVITRLKHQGASSRESQGRGFPTRISFVLAVWALCATQAYGQNPPNTFYVETELNGVTACSTAGRPRGVML